MTAIGNHKYLLLSCSRWCTVEK